MQPENDSGNENDRFEQYLRQFQPRPPAPLPAMMETPASRVRPLLAVAALIVAACGLAVWTTVLPERFEPTTRTTILRPVGNTLPMGAVSLGRLNALLNEDPARLDAALTEASRHLLPDVQRRDGSLWALAQD